MPKKSKTLGKTFDNIRDAIIATSKEASFEILTGIKLLAKQGVPVVTGELRFSIETHLSDKENYVSANAPYAVFVDATYFYIAVLAAMASSGRLLKLIATNELRTALNGN